MLKVFGSTTAHALACNDRGRENMPGKKRKQLDSPASGKEEKKTKTEEEKEKEEPQKPSEPTSKRQLTFEEGEASAPSGRRYWVMKSEPNKDSSKKSTSVTAWWT